MILGYARVSTLGQSLVNQKAALEAAGAAKLFCEKVSGAKVDRPELKRMMGMLRSGDTVLVTKLDRLGRSTRELLGLIDTIGKTGAFFKSLGDPMWDTSTPTGKLLGTLLVAIADFERDMILERTEHGRRIAMARGVKFGRKPVLSTDQERAIRIRRENGETVTALAAAYEVSRRTIARLCAN